MIIKLLRKIFVSGDTDKKVAEIDAKNKKVFEDTAQSAKRHSDLLKKNGVTMRIFIASGGDHRSGH